MLIATRLFGEIRVEEDKVLTFPAGLVGLKELKRFVLLDSPRDKPFRWLQSVDDPGTAFLTVEPTVFRPGYRVAVHKEDLARLGIGRRTEVLVLCIVTVQREPRRLTANLQGPLLINAESRIGRQLILVEGGYHTRHDILEEMAASPGGGAPAGGELLEVKNQGE